MTRTTYASVYIANLGKYNEGYLVGQWLPLPFKEKELHDLFANIGLGYFQDGTYIHGLEVEGIVHEEYAIHDFDCEIEGISIGEYASLDRLNTLFEALEELDEWDLQKFQAAASYFGYAPEEIIDRLDDFYLYSDIHDEADLGYYFIEESGCYDLSHMGSLARYIDYEAFGRDIGIEASGGFTPYGYIEEM